MFWVGIEPNLMVFALTTDAPRQTQWLSDWTELNTFLFKQGNPFRTYLQQSDLNNREI